MIRADLIIEGAAEVVTCAGPWPARGDPSPQAAVSAVPRGAVACEGERIVFVGPAEECRRAVSLGPGGIRVDAAGGVVLPGFVDPHTHLPFGGWREADFERRLAGASYLEIAASGGGILSTVRATRSLGAGALTALVAQRLDEMMLSGTTTVEAKSGYGLSEDSEVEILRALRNAAHHPVEIIPTFLGAHVVPPEFRDGKREEYVKLLAGKLIPRIAREGLARFCDVFVDEGAYTIDEARRILEAARLCGLGLRVHAEQLSRTGAAQLGASLGAFSVDHLERLDDADIAALAATWGEGGGTAAAGSGRGPSVARGTVAILLPGAAHFLGEPRHPPVRALISAGVPVAIATDFNPGTSPCLAMPEMVSLACLLYGMSPDEALVAATRHAALSLGIETRAGSLEVGKQADMVIWEVSDRRHLAYRFGPIPCTMVVKRGRIAFDRSRIQKALRGASRAMAGESADTGREAEMLIDLSSGSFLEQLSSERPTPGGGSASALAGAQAAALVEMVCALTLKSDKHAASRPLVEPFRARASELRGRLSTLVDRDAAAYDEVVAANRLPRETEDQKAARKQARARAFRLAAEVPLQSAELASGVIALAAEAAPHINANAASDLVVAALLAQAALHGAGANVKINLDSLKSESFAAAARERLDAWGRDADASVAAIRSRFSL